MNVQNQSGDQPFWIKALNALMVLLAVAIGGMALCLFLLQIEPLEPSEAETTGSESSASSMTSSVESSASLVDSESSM